MHARGEEERWELPRTTLAAGQARAYVDRHRAALGEDGWRRARLLISELATNAVRHGAGRIELSVSATGDGLRFCVSDEGDGRIAFRTPGPGGGFGLHLVDDLADRWGRAADGACVWFEIDREVAA